MKVFSATTLALAAASIAALSWAARPAGAQLPRPAEIEAPPAALKPPPPPPPAASEEPPPAPGAGRETREGRDGRKGGYGGPDAGNRYRAASLADILNAFAESREKAAETYSENVLVTDAAISSVSEPDNGLRVVALEIANLPDKREREGALELKCVINPHFPEEDAAAASYRPGLPRLFFGKFARQDGNAVYFGCVDIQAYLEALAGEKPAD
ncbi:MAG: hypothetical protein LBQ12_12580 [Deltaproteobacteria bacterium]|nr:hypothetical protein [Deltaproteobacteria bacterium]